MDLTNEDKQLAERVSQGVRDYFKQTGKKEAKSWDIYNFLSLNGLIEKDQHKGLHFKMFLKRLKNAGQLQLIPECRFKNRWYFYSDPDQQAKLDEYEIKRKTLHLPELSEEEIHLLIEAEKLKIEKLPKRDPSDFTSQKIQVRTKYPRAYEYWSGIEITTMKKVFLSTGDIHQVAELLKRQPLVVKEKLKELKIL